MQNSVVDGLNHGQTERCWPDKNKLLCLSLHTDDVEGGDTTWLASAKYRTSIDESWYPASYSCSYMKLSDILTQQISNNDGVVRSKSTSLSGIARENIWSRDEVVSFMAENRIGGTFIDCDAIRRIIQDGSEASLGTTDARREVIFGES